MDTGTAILVSTLVVVAAVLVVVLVRRSGNRSELSSESLRAMLADVLDAPAAARHRRTAAGGAAGDADLEVGSGDVDGELGDHDVDAAAPRRPLVDARLTEVAAALPRTAATHSAATVPSAAPAGPTELGNSASTADGERSDSIPAGPAGASAASGAASLDPVGPVSETVDEVLLAARADAERLRAEARRDADAMRAAAARERARGEEATQALAEERQTLADDRERLRLDRADIARQRRDIAEREQALHERMAAADARQVGLDQARIEVDAAQAGVDRAQADLVRQAADHQQAHVTELERISSLTADEAHAELLSSQEESVRRDAAIMIRRIESEAQSTAKGRARQIVADAIARVASDQTSQSVVSVLHLPSDELKGRIIGREGRNIRAFETVTGVNVIIDDTPEAVLLSCFDPVRREVGRVTLEALIEDGRIHPHRIEEAFERAHEEVESLCQRAAEDALLEVGITDVHPELVALIGQLKYRTSYGQNVLGHLVETSHIARIMAAELGVDPVIVARGAFLHDIGKALTHEAHGSHAIVGAEIARKYGESAEVVHCIEAHHDEVPPATVEAVLTQAADACSGGRPGARRESLESYVQRLEHIEAIAAAKKGVEKVFAMQAGRELRVMVKPEIVDDLEAHLIAREVAKQIEEELTYPGQVRVTVIRESRATEVAR